jgi:hypothetical protein
MLLHACTALSYLAVGTGLLLANAICVICLRSQAGRVSRVRSHQPSSHARIHAFGNPLTPMDLGSSGVSRSGLASA